MSYQGRQAAPPASVNTGAEYRCLRLDGLPADLTALAPIRHRLAQFAHEIGLPADTTGDMLLATYEALANVAEHAYPPGEPGTYDLCAVDRPDEGVLTVSIVDRGSWKPQADTSRTRRGRGIRLMHACSDSARVETGDEGTRIHLQWNYGTDRTSLPESEQQVEP
ncbi:ATP-binding protein [Rhodococcus sp. NPDC003382]|uniref:ATP-binding protein n=1 Tax=unclassified Rhodococcus (in: high G+C Gram-positive bacteria) TaxID=192944 RepID=UPI0018CE33FA|nr:MULTISPECIES: ATP-binding protein [unclassified Rhodococcus (in: high G+C Gram-positive bacteria)]MBH0120417.1 ATP-binding protein [Rhodococcus sp. CX]MCK8673842.1 ATP-binding protein [Rhodococcus sp. HM1]